MAVKLEKKAVAYDAGEHKERVMAMLSALAASPGAPHCPEVGPLVREVRARLSIKIKRAELASLLSERIGGAPPSFHGMISPREAATLRKVIRHGSEAKVRFYRSDARAPMKVWIAGRGFEQGNTLSNAASMALRKRGILVRESEGITGGDAGLFRLAPRAEEPGMFWVR